MRTSLNLNDTFDTMVWAIAAIAFWCQCRLSEVCTDSSFDLSIHPSHSSPHKYGVTASNITFHSFWAPSKKMKLCGEFIMWTDSGDTSSAEWAFNNHMKINNLRHINMPPYKRENFFRDPNHPPPTSDAPILLAALSQ